MFLIFQKVMSLLILPPPPKKKILALKYSNVFIGLTPTFASYPPLLGVLTIGRRGAKKEMGVR
jgi:hypothetical protein